MHVFIIIIQIDNCCRPSDTYIWPIISPAGLSVPINSPQRAIGFASFNKYQMFTQKLPILVWEGPKPSPYSPFALPNKCLAFKMNFVFVSSVCL